MRTWASSGPGAARHRVALRRRRWRETALLDAALAGAASSPAAGYVGRVATGVGSLLALLALRAWQAAARAAQLGAERDALERDARAARRRAEDAEEAAVEARTAGFGQRFARELAARCFRGWARAVEDQREQERKAFADARKKDDLHRDALLLQFLFCYPS